MTVRRFVTKATPLPSIQNGRATEQQVRDWGLASRKVTIRSCMYCKTVYLDAGRANLCEHWHEGSPP